MTRLGPYSNSTCPSRNMSLCDLHQLGNSRLENRFVFGAKKSGQDQVLVLVGDVEGAVVDPPVEDVSVHSGAPGVLKTKC